jgi:hypothetical protein
MIETSANIVSLKDECESGVTSQWDEMSVCFTPTAGCLPPPFIGQGEAATSMLYSEMHSIYILANSAPGGSIVLANPCAQRRLMANSDFPRCRGSSCACRGIVSRGGFDQRLCLVVVHTLIEGVFMLILRALFMGEGSGAGSIGAGVALSCQHRASQRRGWMHGARDGRIVPGMAEKTWLE